MAIHIDSINILQLYLRGVLDRADHHAGSVQGVALTLIGAILWKSDNEIRVREYGGRPANMIWFSVNDTEYMMKYNHNNETIELHNRNDDRLIFEFDNTTTYEKIISIFQKL
ncbi:MAG: hypothetical protein ACRC3B_14630 [Bacteroidia bacterium]